MPQCPIAGDANVRVPVDLADVAAASVVGIIIRAARHYIAMFYASPRQNYAYTIINSTSNPSTSGPVALWQGATAPPLPPPPKKKK